GGAPSDEGAVEDGLPSETEGVNPSPADASPAETDAPADEAAPSDAAPSPDAASAVDYVKMTLSAGIAPLEMRFAQINSCYRRLPIAYRSFTYINSVIEGVIPPEKYAYAADETDRGEKLARWNVTKAVEALKTFEAFDRHVDFVTARVPASLTRLPDPYAWIKDLLARLDYTEHPERLCLEFPRSLLYEDVEVARPALLAFKIAKVRTLMSGCGERDCPVTALVDLPVDMVLLAPRVSAYSDNRDKGRVFSEFINFLRALPVDVIGDGLYNDDQITAHSRADCLGYIPSSGYEGAAEHGSLRMTLDEAVEQKEDEV
ncbi:MAG: EAL domain-containing protein, partial [Clostridia bacterium]|nr:EAL domain-containing protein [Clostridia bacterium]